MKATPWPPTPGCLTIRCGMPPIKALKKCPWGMFWHIHNAVIKWNHVPRYWPFVRGIHRSPVNSPQKGQWRRALMFSLIFAWINGWVTNCKAGDSRHHRPLWRHYNVSCKVLLVSNLIFPCLSGETDMLHILCTSILVFYLHHWLIIQRLRYL